MRTIIDLPEQQLKGLQQLADAQHASRAEIVRQAVAEYLTRAEQRSQPHSAWEAAYGMWARNPKEPGEDGLKYQLRLREEWSGRDQVIEEVIETRVPLAAQKKVSYAAGTPPSPTRASKKITR